MKVEMVRANQSPVGFCTNKPGPFTQGPGDRAEDSKLHEISRLHLSLSWLAEKGLRPNCTRGVGREGETARLRGKRGWWGGHS